MCDSLEMGKIDQYWSASEPVLVADSDQYYSELWPVLVKEATSTGSFSTLLYKDS